VFSRSSTPFATACALLLVGGSWSIASRAEDVETSVAATAGAAYGDLVAQIALVEARTTLNPRLSVAAGLAYLHVEHGYREAQMRVHAITRMTIGRWVIDDRNMLSVSSESAERYRNRLRATFPALRGRSRLSAHAFNELFFDFDRGAFVRNNVALGLGAAIGDCCRVELYHVWSDNRGAPDTRFVLAIASMTIRASSWR
jgi:hypothetical protein